MVLLHCTSFSFILAFYFLKQTKISEWNRRSGCLYTSFFPHTQQILKHLLLEITHGTLSKSVLLYFLPRELLMKVIGFWRVELHSEKQPVRWAVWKRQKDGTRSGRERGLNGVQWKWKENVTEMRFSSKDSNLYTETEGNKRNKKQNKFKSQGHTKLS